MITAKEKNKPIVLIDTKNLNINELTLSTHLSVSELQHIRLLKLMKWHDLVVKENS